MSGFKTYEVHTVKTPEDAEAKMNEMANFHWQVKTVTHWENSNGHWLVITFEKDDK